MKFILPVQEDVGLNGVQEDPRARAAKPMSLIVEPAGLCSRAREPRLLRGSCAAAKSSITHPRACALEQESHHIRSPHTE